MCITVIERVKRKFGNGHRKQERRLESLRQLRKKLGSKEGELNVKLERCQSAIDKKLLEKKLIVLREHCNKIDKRLS
jgi:hypothetical protein